MRTHSFRPPPTAHTAHQWWGEKSPGVWEDARRWHLTNVWVDSRGTERKNVVCAWGMLLVWDLESQRWLSLPGNDPAWLFLSTWRCLRYTYPVCRTRMPQAKTGSKSNNFLLLGETAHPRETPSLSSGASPPLPSSRTCSWRTEVVLCLELVVCCVSYMMAAAVGL